MENVMKKENETQTVTLNEFKMKMMNALLTCQGHIAAIAKMLASGKGCEDILMQISAVDSALRKVGKQILINHLEHCVKDGVANGEDSIGSFSKLLDRYLLN